MLVIHHIPAVAFRMGWVLLSLAACAAAQETADVQKLATRDAGPAVIAPDIRTLFKVKYVAQGSVYLDGGRGAGLAEGMTLTIKRVGTQATQSGSGEATGNWIVAQLQVVSVADSS